MIGYTLIDIESGKRWEIMDKVKKRNNSTNEDVYILSDADGNLKSETAAYIYQDYTLKK
jgi:hypothetical protein